MSATQTITDDNGQTHTAHCSFHASTTLLEELELQGVTDIEAEWDISAKACVSMWLSNGTVPCRCNEK